MNLHEKYPTTMDELQKLCEIIENKRKSLHAYDALSNDHTVVAPGGSNFLIAGAIMIEINHSIYEEGTERDNYDINVGTICLFGNGLTSAFNLVGVCVIAIASDIMDLAVSVNDNICSVNDYPDVENREVCAAKQIGGYFSMMFFIFSVISPILMALLYEAKFDKSKIIPTFTKPNFSNEDWMVMLLCGFIYAIVQLLCAWFIGPELVCLLAAGFALVGYYMFQQCRVYGRTMNGKPNISKRKFALPFILLLGVLCIVRLIPGVEDALEVF
jgi:L-lactate permease